MPDFAWSEYRLRSRPPISWNSETRPLQVSARMMSPRRVQHEELHERLASRGHHARFENRERAQYRDANRGSCMLVAARLHQPAPCDPRPSSTTISPSPGTYEASHEKRPRDRIECSRGAVPRFGPRYLYVVPAARSGLWASQFMMSLSLILSSSFSVDDVPVDGLATDDL